MNKEYFKKYYHLERTHWWFKARERILFSYANHALDSNSKSNILNVGIATGASTMMLEKLGSVTSLEYDEDCCNFVRQELGIPVINGSLTDLPFQECSYDLVTAFDVIEHIEDDDKALSEIDRVLSPNGKCIVTVPAYQFLWSNHDVINQHFRRYTMNPLLKKIKRVGLKIDFSSYFNSLLFPASASVIMLSKLIGSNKESNFDMTGDGGLLNKLFFEIFKFERNLLHIPIRFPFGLSILVVASKKNRS